MNVPEEEEEELRLFIVYFHHNHYILIKITIQNNTVTIVNKGTRRMISIFSTTTTKIQKILYNIH